MIMVNTAVITDGTTVEYGSAEPASLLICTTMTGKTGAKAMLTTANIHMSLLARGEKWF